MPRWAYTVILTVIGLVLLVGGGALVSQTTRAAVPYAVGDVFASVGRGQVNHFSAAGTLIEVLDTTTGSTFTAGGCFDTAGNFYVMDFSTNQVSKFTNIGTLVTASFGSGFNASPESCVLDAAGKIYVGQASGSGNILKFDPSGTLLSSFAPAPENRGSDWITLATDQCTMLYTSEGTASRPSMCVPMRSSPTSPRGYPGRALRSTSDSMARSLWPVGQQSSA